MKTYNFSAIAIAVVASALWITSCQNEDLATPAFMINQEKIEPDPGSAFLSFNPTVVRGRPTREFTKDWWKYVVSFNRAQSPLNEVQVLAPSSGQIGMIHFLVGSKTGEVSRKIETSSDKALLVPLVATVKTYPSTDASFKPAPGQTINHLLKSSAAREIEQVTKMSATLDGKPIDVTAANRFSTEVFSIIGNRDLGNFQDLGITGKQQAAVSDGYWLVLQNISKGQHILRVEAEIPTKGTRTEVTYDIKVR